MLCVVGGHVLQVGKQYTSSEFIKFFFELLIGFFSLLTWQVMLKCIYTSLMWQSVKGHAFPLM